MSHELVARAGLAYLAVSTALVGFWAQLAPQSFYDHFPGMGRVWISIDGPYNEHLIRDVGGLNLALTVLLVGAIVTLSRSLVLTACLAALAYGVPHVIYHLFTTEAMDTVDVIGVIGGLALFATIPALIMWTTTRFDPAP